MTTDRFFGGVEGRIENLLSMLEYLAEDSRSEEELWDWIKSNTSGSSDSTISTYVRFIRTLGLIEQADGICSLTEEGENYLHSEDDELLYSALTSKVKGFETILQAISNGDRSKEEIQAQMRARYPGYSLPMAIVGRHLEWLEAIDYVRPVDGGYILTSSGMAAAESLDSGWIEPTVETPGSGDRGSEDLDNLRKSAQQDAQESASSTTTTREVTDYDRSDPIRRYVKTRADGACEGCGDPAPFENTRRKPYLEAHHIHEVSGGGTDSLETVIALCPNCHYRVHRGRDGKQFNRELAHRLASIEDVDIETVLG